MDTKIDGRGAEPTVQKINIGGQEYDPTEASELLGKGKLAREYEQKWNSPIDSLASAYGKSQSELQTERAEKARLAQELQTYQAKKEAGTETALDTRKAQEALRKFNVAFTDDLEKSGYIKKDELPKYVEEMLTQREQVQKLISQADKLEGEITGEDGRPSFNKKVVLAYMNAYGIEDPKAAYEEMYGPQLKAWQDKQVAEKKNPSLRTFRNGGGAKNPERPKITDDNFRNALEEVLS